MAQRIDLNLQDSLQLLLEQITLALPASWPPGLRMFTLFAGLMLLAISLRLLLEFGLLALRRQIMGRLHNLSAGVHVVLDERVLRRASPLQSPRHEAISGKYSMGAAARSEPRITSSLKLFQSKPSVSE